jgi:mycofactocin precursor
MTVTRYDNTTLPVQERGPAEIGEPEATADPLDQGLAALIEEDLLVEDVSIDGMCGVY